MLYSKEYPLIHKGIHASNEPNGVRLGQSL